MAILTISVDDRIIPLLEKNAIEQGSNKSAVGNAILQKHYKLKPKPKFVNINRSKQLSRRR